MVGTSKRPPSKFYQQYPRMPVVVTTQAKGRRNAMVVARHTFINTDPPLYGISISSETFTYQLIAESKEFGINFLPFEAAELVDALGSTKGREIDKFQKFNLAVVKPEKTAVPILKAAYAAYECKLTEQKDYGRYRWLVGEVVALHTLKECQAPQNILDVNSVNPILYLGEQHYLTVAKGTLKYVPR